MSRIKIENLPKDKKLPVEEMKKIRGGIIVQGPHGRLGIIGEGGRQKIRGSAPFNGPGIVIWTGPVDEG